MKRTKIVASITVKHCEHCPVRVYDEGKKLYFCPRIRDYLKLDIKDFPDECPLQDGELSD